MLNKYLIIELASYGHGVSEKANISSHIIKT